MSFLEPFERRNLSANDPALKALIESWGGGESISGARINHQTAHQISSFFACVSIISETVASLPLLTYRRLQGGKERAPKHALYPILHDAPNPMMTRMEFFEIQQGWLLTWGNAFSEIERNGGGDVVALWPLAPNRMKIKIRNGRLWYYWTPLDSTTEIELADFQVVHARGYGSDGIIGYSPVDLFRETIGLCKAEEEYRARFFKNDARPGAVVEYPGNLSDLSYKRYKEDWQQTYGGLGNKFRVAFLEGGLKWHDVGFPPQTSEFIEGRKFQIEEVARIFKVPLILLQSTEKATSWGTGIEQFMLAFVMHCIRPWLVRWENRLNLSLFTDSERLQYFAEFLIDGLLRADIRTRNESYRIAIEGGWMTRNEARAAENMNKASGLDRFLVQQNLAMVDETGNVIPINKPDGEEDQPPSQLNGNGNGRFKQVNE